MSDLFTYKKITTVLLPGAGLENLCITARINFYRDVYIKVVIKFDIRVTGKGYI